MMAKNKHVLRQNQRSDKWDVYANTEGNVSFFKDILKLFEIEKNNNFSISKGYKKIENRGRKIQLVVSCP